MTCSAVGATSASTPVRRSFAPRRSGSARMKGTGFERVGGVRLAGDRVDHHLAVAVVGGDEHGHALRSCAAAQSRPMHSSTTFTALTAASSDAGVADHVGVGEVDQDEAVAARCRCAATSLSVTSRALISGFWS